MKDPMIPKDVEGTSYLHGEYYPSHKFKSEHESGEKTSRFSFLFLKYPYETREKAGCKSTCL